MCDRTPNFVVGNASEGRTGCVNERSQHKKDMQKFWKGAIKEREKENQLAIWKKGKKRRLTELELSAIPPPIYYPDLDKSTTTTPSPVKKLTLYQFDLYIKLYPRPTFKSYDKSYDISNEEAVRGALKNNRPKNKPRALYISLTIEIESRNPSIFQCYSYIQHLSRSDTEYPSLKEKSPSSLSIFYENETLKSTY
ncbi:20457_t:CDS:2 [Funneliformis geosporum]|uniref:423_t:CDS:1 n=1 Tax=Funneliformis geosporum TaxID=1117311 RepID=A0A9W4SZT4_9GLOM|nr:423_t:CDS:2 [Funneliformis geosporum]CAI2187582.1 20457_t:CDS:2 [Funneliformis geosporum]